MCSRSHRLDASHRASAPETIKIAVVAVCLGTPNAILNIARKPAPQFALSIESLLNQVVLISSSRIVDTNGIPWCLRFRKIVVGSLWAGRKVNFEKPVQGDAYIMPEH